MSKQWDDEYISQALDEEIELARLDKNLCGKKPAGASRGSPIWHSTGGAPRGGYGGLTATPLPQYRRELRDAGELCIRRAINVKHDHDECSVSASYGSSRRAVTEFYGMHPDSAAATMAAITRAAIQLLTEQRDERAALNPTRSKSSRKPSARAKSNP
jgi:hypothetical protein